MSSAVTVVHIWSTVHTIKHSLARLVVQSSRYKCNIIRVNEQPTSQLIYTPLKVPNSIPSDPQLLLSFQSVYLATTVPQNIKGNKIMGRHTPTRSSLRHSRMLVISKDLRGTNYYENWERTLLKAIHHIFFPGALNPLNIFYPKLATSFLVLQILMGLLITAIGLWFLLWAPNTRIQDNPYWSGLIVSVLFSTCISPTN